MSNVVLNCYIEIIKTFKVLSEVYGSNVSIYFDGIFCCCKCFKENESQKL